MTRYFMRDTPLCQMEQQMMTPPYFKPRGHGRYYPGFQYSRDDMECPYCMNFRRNHPCPLEQCVCLDERIAAGALNLNEFVRDCFFPEAGVQLLARLERNFTCCSISFFLNECHRERWQHWRERYYRMSGRNLAALFLLTAYEEIWRRMIWKFDARGFDFQSVQLSGIQPELYSVYQAAKAISTGSRNITLADLASPELVTDEAFHLIVCALLLAKYMTTLYRYKRSTIHIISSVLRDFFRYLYMTGVLKDDLSGDVPRPKIYVEESFPETWTPEEIWQLLSAINRRTAVGKRDYAMILLAAVLGMRAGDICALKFREIDWHKKVITYTQQKSGKINALPLLSPIGDAIIDYLKNGRLDSDCDNVFIRHVHPYGPIASSSTLSENIKRYMRQAGMTIRKRKVAHSMRHREGPRIIAFCS